MLDRDAETGKRYGLAYAEAYHYIGPPPAKVDEYVPNPRRKALKRPETTRYAARLRDRDVRHAGPGYRRPPARLRPSRRRP